MQNFRLIAPLTFTFFLFYISTLSAQNCSAICDFLPTGFVPTDDCEDFENYELGDHISEVSNDWFLLPIVETTTIDGFISDNISENENVLKICRFDDPVEIANVYRTLENPMVSDRYVFQFDIYIPDGEGAVIDFFGANTDESKIKLTFNNEILEIDGSENCLNSNTCIPYYTDSWMRYTLNIDRSSNSIGIILDGDIFVGSSEFTYNGSPSDLMAGFRLDASRGTFYMDNICYARQPPCNDSEIFCGISQSYSNLNSGNNISFASNLCGPSNGNPDYNGNDVVVKYVRGSDQLDNWITLWNDGSQDLDLFIFDSCPLTNFEATCVGSSTNSIKCNSNYETINLTGWPAGEYYILIDGKSASDLESLFWLAVSCEGLYCGDAMEANCGSNSGDTGPLLINNSSNYYSCYIPRPNTCFRPDNTENGLGYRGSFTGPEDIWFFVAPEDGAYEFVMTPELGVDLELFLLKNCCPVQDYDGGIYILTDLSGQECYGSGNCLQASTQSAGDPEIIIYDMMKGDSVFIVVDGFLGDKGMYDLSIKCNNFNCEDVVDIYCGDAFQDTNDPQANDPFTSTQITSIIDHHDGCDGLDEGCGEQPFDGNNEFKSHEVIYHYVDDFFEPHDVFIDLFPVSPFDLDVDLFVYRTCSETNQLMDCVATSTFEPGKKDAVVLNNVTFGDEFYIVVDGQSNTFNTTEGIFELTITCGDLCEKIPANLPCNITVSESTDTFDDSNTNTMYCGCENSPDGVEVGYTGNEDVYYFDLTTTQEITITLDDLQFRDLYMFLLDTCDFNSCILSSKYATSGLNEIKRTLTPGRYYIVVDGDMGGNGDYQIRIDGCDPYCQDFLPNASSSENNLVDWINTTGYECKYFVVHFTPDPLNPNHDSFEAFSDSIFVSEEQELEYYCPLPGCYEFCFYYCDEDGNIIECCTKYCADSPRYDCAYYFPYLEVLDDNGEGSASCRFYCYESPINEPNIIFQDSSYITIDEEIYFPDENGYVDITLPYGEYTVCCYRYDPICHYWEVCCRTYCIPYIPKEEYCEEGAFTFVQNPNQANQFNIVVDPTLLNPEIDFFNSSPGILNCSTDDILCVELTEPGSYEICFLANDDSYQCCQYLCWDGSEVHESEDCIEVIPLEPEYFSLECTLDKKVIKWSVICTGLACDPLTPIDCVEEIYYGSHPRIKLIPGLRYHICKYYLDCCGQIKKCCMDYCYNPFRPFVDGIENPAYEHCADISLSSTNIDEHGNAHISFSYTGPEIQETSLWQLYEIEDQSVTLLEEGGLGQAALTFSHLRPGRTYYLCYKYLCDDGCYQYCCIKIYIPEDCNYHIPRYIGNGDDLTFQYEAALNSNQTLVNWFVDDNEIGVEGIYNYPAPGMYHVCCLIWDQESNCYILCCQKYCIAPPLECGENQGITAVFDAALGQFDLFIPGVPAANVISWNIDVPSDVNPNFIGADSPQIFRPADFNIDLNEEIIVSVKYRDADGCIRICCKRLCPRGGGECFNNPLEDLCENIDTLYFEDFESYNDGDLIAQQNTGRWTAADPNYDAVILNTGNNNVLNFSMVTGNDSTNVILQIDDQPQNYKRYKISHDWYLQYANGGADLFHAQNRLYLIHVSDLKIWIDLVVGQENGQNFASLYFVEENQLNSTRTKLTDIDLIANYSGNNPVPKFKVAWIYDKEARSITAILNNEIIYQGLLAMPAIDSEILYEIVEWNNLPDYADIDNICVAACQNDIELPCKDRKDIVCEYFENFQTNNPVSNATSWTDGGSGQSCLVQSENNNNYLEVQPLNTGSCAAEYTITDLALPDDVIVFEYQLLIPSGEGIQTILSGLGQNSIGINFKEENANDFINYQIGNQFFSGNANDGFIPFDIPKDEYFPIQYILNKTSTELTIYINDRLLKSLSYSGFQTFQKFYIDNQLTNNQAAHLDNVCYSVCGKCEGRFYPVLSDFEPCGQIEINYIKPHAGNQYEIEIEADASLGIGPDSEWLIYQVSPENDTTLFETGFGGRVFNSTNENFNEFKGNYDYFCCYRYIDENGCNAFCCIQFCLGAEIICSPFLVAQNENDPRSFSFTNTIADGSEYNWDLGDGTVLSTFENEVIDHTFAASDSYTICLEVVDDCQNIVCEQCITITIGQLSVSTEVIHPSCQNTFDGQINLDILTGTEPYSIAWNDGSSELSRSGLSIGNYSVSISDASSLDTTFSFQLVAPELPLLLLDIERTSCGENNGSIFVLSQNETNINGLSIAPNAGVAMTLGFGMLAPNIYSLKVDDEYGCQTDTTFVVEASEELNIDLGPDRMVCPGELTSIMINHSDINASYRWFLDGVELAGENTNTLLPGLSGIYSAEIQDGLGCIAYDSIFVDLLPTILQSPPGQLSVDVNEPIEIFIPNATSVVWSSDFGDFSCQECTIATFTTEQSSEVLFTATDTNNCSLEGQIQIEINSELILPNYLSPNGDGKNDVLRFNLPVNVQNVALTIFNKWGQLISEMTNYNNDWNAVDEQGRKLPDGAYYYILKYESSEGIQRKSSDLTIISNN